MKEKVIKVIAEFEELDKQLSDPAIFSDPKKAAEVAQKRKAMLEKYELAVEYLKFSNQKDESENILKTDKDPEMQELAKMELDDAKTNLPILEEKLRTALIPRDPSDEKNAIVEIRPGAGGDESALFAGEYARAVLKFAEDEGFKAEIISESATDG